MIFSTYIIDDPASYLDVKQLKWSTPSEARAPRVKYITALLAHPVKTPQDWTLAARVEDLLLCCTTEREIHPLRLPQCHQCSG